MGWVSVVYGGGEKWLDICRFCVYFDGRVNRIY